MDSRPNTEPGSPPIFDSNGHRNMNEAMSISEIVSAMHACVDRFEEVLLARDAKHKAEIGPIQEKFELERLMRLQAEEEVKRAQKSYEALLKKVKESGLHDVNTIEELRNKNPELKRKRVDDNGCNNVIAELRNRVVELEKENANKKNLATIEKLRAKNTKLTCKKINADAEPLGNLCASVGGNTEEGEPQAPLQRNIGTGHTLGASVVTILKTTHATLTKKISGDKASVKRKFAAQKLPMVDPDHKKRTHSSRCSPSYLANLWEGLSKEKMDDVELMGFGSLKHLPVWNVNHKFMVALAKAYDTETHILATPAIRFKITHDLIGNALGLPFRGKSFSDPKTPKEERLVKPFRGVKLKMLKDQLIDNQLRDNEDIDSFRRAFIMLALKSFLCPNSVAITAPWQIPTIVDVLNPTEYNWARYINDRLVVGIKKYKLEGTEAIDGCLYVLMILYLHSLEYGSLNNYKGPPSPWIKYWPANVLNKKMAEEASRATGLIYTYPTNNMNGAQRKEKRKEKEPIVVSPVKKVKRVVVMQKKKNQDEKKKRPEKKKVQVKQTKERG